MKRVFTICIAVFVSIFTLACAQPALEEVPSEPQLENGSFFADLNGFNIHYEVWGEGPVVMTVPNSWGLSLEGVRALYEPLETKVTMVYFDPRGMGESAPIAEESDMGLTAVRSDFHALRTHLGLDTVHVIGWSNGAMNLIFLAAEHPEALKTATFVHGVASYTEEDSKIWAESYPELMQQFGQFMAEMANESLTDEDRNTRVRPMWIEDFFPVMFADQEAGRELLPTLYANTEFSWGHFAYSNQESPTFEGRDKLPAITIPCLVVAGAHDMTPPEKVQELSDGLSDARYELFENSGHFAPVEETQRFKQLYWSFVGVGEEEEHTH
ncbi:MAG: alpha/beta hydrolase [bacterium]|nr:alpha/beta hydrolase [bacterium]